MSDALPLQASALLICLAMAGGCDKLDPRHKAAEPDGAPSEQELQQIGYLPAESPKPGARKLYNHLEQAKSCADYELAMRWNRPPNVEGGVFHRKLVFLSSNVPADLPQESEVLITGKIARGDVLPSGSARWTLQMQDGTRVQAIETANYWLKQEQAAQEAHKGDPVAIVNPEKRGRMLCVQGIYQGRMGKDPDGEANLPLVSVLYAMDRDR
jgi:hypothetical protein